jgi:hypothetical protein
VVELLMLGLGAAVAILGMLLGFFAVSAAEPPLDRAMRSDTGPRVSTTPLPSRSRGPLAVSPQKTNRVRPACRAR